MELPSCINFYKKFLLKKNKKITNDDKLGVPIELKDLEFEEILVYENFIDYKLVSAEVISCSLVKKGFGDSFTYTLDLIERKKG